jgi:BlaI family transcriptional regulator, penicillinase repressor
MMAQRAALSKAEMETARIVWNLGEATVRQVLEALPEDRQIDYKTVQTFLRRLEGKGYLHARREGKTIHYRPRVRAAQVMREAVNDFVGRLFDGEALPLVEHLIADHGLTTAEIAKLREVLDQLEEENQ